MAAFLAFSMDALLFQWLYQDDTYTLQASSGYVCFQPAILFLADVIQVANLPPLPPRRISRALPYDCGAQEQCGIGDSCPEQSARNGRRSSL